MMALTALVLSLGYKLVLTSQLFRVTARAKCWRSNQYVNTLSTALMGIAAYLGRWRLVSSWV